MGLQQEGTPQGKPEEKMVEIKGPKTGATTRVPEGSPLTRLSNADKQMDLIAQTMALAPGQVIVGQWDAAAGEFKVEEKDLLAQEQDQSAASSSAPSPSSSG